MSLKSKTNVNASRNYSALNDTRLFSDGVRLHPVLDGILRHFHSICPGCRLSNAEFNRSAIRMLAELKLIILIDPKLEIPSWFSRRNFNLARRGNMLPIWMPAQDFRNARERLDLISPQMENNEVVWLGLDFEVSEDRTLH